MRVLGGDMAGARHRAAICPRIAYMPQGLGRNLYPDLSVRENVDFFARLFGQGRAEREARIAALLDSDGPCPLRRPAAKKLSGGMKQKLGLCCALVHDPDLLILDEPTTGVDPLSRRQFWDLVAQMRAGRPGMSVLVATAYMEEAERFDWLVAMDAGRVLATGTPAAIKAGVGAATLEDAFIALLPEARRHGHRRLVIPPRPAVGGAAGDRGPRPDPAVRWLHCGGPGELRGRARRDLRLPRLERLRQDHDDEDADRPAAGLRGEALLFGRPVDASDPEARRRVGYMSQSFSLYGELTVRQNLDLHARLFRLPRAKAPARIAELVGAVRPRRVPRREFRGTAARPATAPLPGRRGRCTSRRS